MPAAFGHNIVAAAGRPRSDGAIDPSPRPDLPARVFQRLAAFYAASFAVLGVYMQFFPVWLHDVGGLSHRQVTEVQSGQILARTVAGPLWAQHVDRTGRPRRTLIALSALSLAAFATFALEPGYGALLLGCVLFGCVYPPMHPLTDNLALEAARAHGFRYPRVRLWGSVSFLVVIVAVGALLERSPSALVFWSILALLLATLAAALWLPRVRRAPNTAAGAPLGRLLRQPRFCAFLVAVALLQGSHGGYYALSTLHWRDHGIGEGVAGWLWAEGVLAEIVLFFAIRDAAERLRPTTLLLIGGAGAVLRWSALALTVDPWAIAAVNWLHAASFGCTYLGSLQFLRRRVAEELQASAQGLLGAATSGLGMVCGTRLAGEVYERSGAGAFWAMAGLALAGALLALWLRRPRPRPRPDALR
ncbi:MAG: MFS transporter [Planctomycetota bacterium]